MAMCVHIYNLLACFQKIKNRKTDLLKHYKNDRVKSKKKYSYPSIKTNIPNFYDIATKDSIRPTSLSLW